MMNKKSFESYGRLFAPLIKKIINDNVPFYRHSETIKWCFGYDEDYSIIATCNRETNLIAVNLKSLIKAYSENDFHTIEYYLLHEIRHVFQHEIVCDYKNGITVPIQKDIVEKWIYEQEHYIKSLDKNGVENPAYFLQDIEMDAYAFSYAVMKYKYGEVDLYVPPIYSKSFYDIVNEWLEAFKEENI